MALQESFEIQGNKLFKRRSWLPVLILVPGAAWFAYLTYLRNEVMPW